MKKFPFVQKTLSSKEINFNFTLIKKKADLYRILSYLLITMKKNIFLIIFLFLLMGEACFSQDKSSVNKFDWLIGEWKGEGSGKPGQGEGSFSFQFDLDNKILVRKSHTEFPSDGGSPTIHDDMMVIYPDFSGDLSNAIYFDNEGHTINYSITTSDAGIVFQSERIAVNVPVFRLTYTLLDKNTVNTKFEMSKDGTTFTTYVEGKSKKM